MKLLRPKVSIIIPTLNSWTTLKANITSLYKQTLTPYEIIVVDNASSDGTPQKIRSEFPEVRLISLNKNIGVTGGRNVGIDKAKKDSQYLFFFDHDMVADRKMIEELVRIAKINLSYGIITPKIFYWEDKKRIWAAGTNINLWTGQVLFRGGRDRGQFDRVEEIQVAPAAILIKREVITAVKKFDDRYFVTYEDTDFCFRARKYDFKTIYAPTAIAFHNISPLRTQEQKRLLNRSFWIGRNRVLFMKDFGKSFFLFLVFSVVYLLYFMKLSLDQKDLQGLINYVRGFIAGVNTRKT